MSVVAAVVLSGILAADWTPMSLTTPWRESWFGGAVSVAIGVGALISAVYPRTSHGRDDEAALFYFGHAASVADVGQLQDEIRRFADDPLRRAADQLWRVSRVVGRKYHLIRIATWALGAGAAVMLAAGVAGAWGPCPLS